jgi:hypothetical protein
MLKAMSVISTNKPFLLLIGGLPATGKTWLARALAEKMSALLMNSDTLRTEMQLRGHYDPASKQRVYDAMLHCAEEALEKNQSVIADSTFYQKKLRQPWMELAKKYGAVFHFMEVTVPESVAMKRLEQKRIDSEADIAVYHNLKADWEDFEFPHLTLDSYRLSPEEMVKKAEHYLSHNHDARAS